MSGRRSSSKSSAGSIIALIVALAAIVTLAWLPLRRGSDGTKVVGVLAIIGGVISLIWLIATSDPPPLELKCFAATSGGLYFVALMMRVFGGREGTPPTAAVQVPIRGDEVVLVQRTAQFLGDKRVRAFGGFGFRLGHGVSTGLGLSAPFHYTGVVDEGDFIVTNRRIILAGAKRTVTLKPGKVIDVNVDDGRVVIRPEQGHVLVIQVADPAVVAGAVKSAMELSA